MTQAEIPQSWARARLDAIAEVRLGRQRSPKRAFGPNMVAYLRAANVTWHGIDLSDVKKMDFSASEVETYRLRAGDILLAEASGSPSEVGKPAIYVDGNETHCFQNTLIRVRSAPEVHRFLHAHFLRDAMLGRFAKIARGVGIQHLGAEALSGWEIVLPPVEEQGRIVDALDSYHTRLDDAVASLERAQAKLKAYRASVLKAAVEGRLVPTEASLARAEKRDYEPADVLLARILNERRCRRDEAELACMKAAGKTPKHAKLRAKYEEPPAPNTTELPVLPEGWCWTSLGALMSIRSGFAFKSEDYLAEEGGVPLIRQSDLRGHRISLAKAKYLPSHFWDKYGKRFGIQEGDILVGLSGSLSSVSIYADERPALQNQRTGLLQVSPLVPRNFALQTYLSVVDRVEKVGKGVAVQNVAPEDIERLAVALPPVAEQARIADEVDRRFSVIEQSIATVAVSIRRCGRLHQSVMKCALEGKLVDQDPNDEPTEILVARIQAESPAAVPAKKASGRRRRGGA